MKQRNTFNSKNTNIINASEMSQFYYCSIAWYLQKCGYEPKSPMLNYGKNKHYNLGKIIDRNQRNIKISKIFAFFGYLILFVGIFIFIFGVVS